MSLINDALKEAKQAQQEAAPPPAPNLQLRPIEPTQYSRGRGSLMWPTALLVVAVLLLIIVWQQRQRNDTAQPTQVQARTAMAATPAAVQRPAPTEVAPAPALEPVPEPARAPATASNGAPNTGAIAAVPLSLEPSSVADSGEGMTNAAPANDTLPKPAPPKLQAIFFSPNRPFVMISGKTLYVGDKLDGLRIAAITQESVTLVGASQTNVLSLSK